MRWSAILLACLLMPAPVVAQTPDFSGSFTMEGQNGPVVVSLQAAGNGQYSGTMSNGNLTWQVQGEVYEGALTGMIDTGQGAFAFEAHIADAQLQIILVEIGPDGVPLTDQGQEFMFTRTASPGRNAASGKSPAFPGFSDSANPAAADPYVGRFTDGQLTLSLQAAAGGYTGQLALGAEAYPVSARRNGDRVEGTMNAPTGQYGIIVAASAEGVVLSNAGTEYALRRVNTGAAGAGSGQASAGAPSGQQGQATEIDNSPLAQQWRAHLSGKKVTYMDSYSSNTAGGGGFSTKFVYHLCSDGRFGFGGSDVVSLNLPGTDVQGGGSSGSSNGTWRIVTQGQLAGIELRFGNGEVELHRLDFQDGQTLADGTRVYVTPGEICN